MSNFQIHELNSVPVNRNSNIIHDTEVSSDEWDTGKNTAGAVADLALEVVASEYDDTASYSIGSYCIYSGVLYRCATATTGVFDVSDWTAVLITGEYKRVRVMHKADFDLLTPEEQADGMIFVDDVDITADDITYSTGVSVADMLDITDITSDYCTTATGVTLEANDSSVYKQGKHIWGNLQFVIPSTTSQQVIATIASGFQPSKTIIGYAGYSGSKWSVDTIGSLYLGTNRNIACTVSVSGKTYVNIVIDYLTA